jgi:hypothetical protein
MKIITLKDISDKINHIAYVPRIHTEDSADIFKVAIKQLEIIGYKCELKGSLTYDSCLHILGLDHDESTNFIEFRCPSPYSWMVNRKHGRITNITTRTKENIFKLVKSYFANEWPNNYKPPVNKI